MPQPNSDKVKVETMKGGQFAVYRYSGNWKDENTKDAREKLATWMKEQQLDATSKPQMAWYDPPFTPTFLRRNEVLVRVNP